jgi:hypothetical protein
MVCAERFTGSKIFLTHPIELLGDMGRLESRFGPFGDGVSFVARYVHGLRQMYHGVKNVLDAPNGPPR